jgi:hypothetical protein
MEELQKTTNVLDANGNWFGIGTETARIIYILDVGFPVQQLPN